MRDNLLIVVAGRKRIGKTTETVRQLLYHAFLDKIKRKSLVFDVNGEMGNILIDNTRHHIKEIKKEEIIRYSNVRGGDIRRIVPRHPNGMPMNGEETEALLIDTITYFRDGILDIEDLNVIYGDILPVKFSGLLCNNAHRACDVMFSLQSVSRLTPKILQNTEIIRTHDQLDDLDDSKGKLLGDYKILKICQLMIKKEVKNGNPRFFIYAYRNDGNIKGNFSPKMLAEAIKQYLLENPSELYSITQRRDIVGKKQYSFEHALNIKIKELFEVYWGNELK